MTSLTQVAVVGAGNMGGAMLARLRDLAWSVGVYDTDAQAQAKALVHGALPMASPLHAARSLAPGGVLLIAVVDAAQTEAVLWGEDGAGPELQPGQTVMLCPTLGPKTVQTQAERLAERGVDCMDAPMSGGPLRARQGTMSLMVACSEPVWQRSQHLLTGLSQQVFRVGVRAGDGART